LDREAPPGLPKGEVKERQNGKKLREKNQNINNYLLPIPPVWGS